MSPASSPTMTTLIACRLALDPTKKLSAQEKKTLEANIQLFRDAIVLFTATGAARGVSGHTGIIVVVIHIVFLISIKAALTIPPLKYVFSSPFSTTPRSFILSYLTKLVCPSLLSFSF